MNNGKEKPIDPFNEIHALTMLYLKNQDLSNLTCEEFVKNYMNTKESIDKALEREISFRSKISFKPR